MNGPIFAEDWIRSDGNGGVIIGDADPMPAEHVSQLIAWICEVAGQPNPIILPRPLVGGCDRAPGWQVTTDQGNVTVESTATVTPDEARFMAAVIAAQADFAEREPLPTLAEVERMATEKGVDPGALARRLFWGYEVTERS